MVDSRVLLGSSIIDTNEHVKGPLEPTIKFTKGNSSSLVSRQASFNKIFEPYKDLKIYKLKVPKLKLASRFKKEKENSLEMNPNQGSVDMRLLLTIKSWKQRSDIK